MHDSVIFREYDIRGIFEKQFDTEFAYLLGRAYVQFQTIRCGKKNPVVT